MGVPPGARAPLSLDQEGLITQERKGLLTPYSQTIIIKHNLTKFGVSKLNAIVMATISF